MSLALLLPQAPTASATEEPPAQPQTTGVISEVGPGTYQSDDDQFQLTENDVPISLMGRTHIVSGAGAGVAQALDAPTTRSDLGVFGPSWQAQFLGGQLNRQLSQGSGFVTTKDLDLNDSVRYNLTDSLARPDGGSTTTYTAADGSTIVVNSVWDDLLGQMATTATETQNVDLTVAPTGDDAPVTAAGTAYAAADLKPKVTWKQVGTGADNWRVSGVGSTATKMSTVSYDTAGRVKQINEPARGETAAQTVKVTYATVTTASGSTLGDVAGQVKDISVTSGATVETLARYSYDGAGLLTKVSNPAAGADLNTYTYDGIDRVTSLTSEDGARWELAYAGEAVAPSATETTGTVPVPGSTATGSPSQDQPEGVAPAAEDFSGSEINDPYAYPSQCSTAYTWMRYSRSGCSTKVAHYGWRNPFWTKTPTGTSVRGIYYDHCTTAPDKPLGYDFRAACDSHDYGYGTIGNAYKGYRYYLDKYKGWQADAEFWNLLYNKTCPKYWTTGACRKIANVYYGFVAVIGRAKNGAYAT
ncbi:phospholipase A2 [Streptomyces sp. NPDC020807]|uniref:phospholipase A2 n=1 Tax=Streptomyces sp. NPDC020807 TaxID=3155119 RepID=UPI00340123D2